LPLKKRDSLSKAEGNIPKMGMELYLNEKQLKDIDIMKAMNMPEGQIIFKLFEDLPRVITGIYERLEYMFLEGLSTGTSIVDNSGDNKNTGTGIKIDYGFISSNNFGVSVLWASNPTTAKPLNDIRLLLNKVRDDGHAVDVVYTDPVTIDALLATDQVRQQYAFNAGFVGTQIPIPSLEQANIALRARYGFTIQEINRSVKVEKNGTQTTAKPWQEGILVFAPSGTLGDLVWTELAEVNHKISGVEYATVDGYILTSKYSVNRPSLREYTSSQAMVIPVITNVDRLYVLDSKTVQA